MFCISRSSDLSMVLHEKLAYKQMSNVAAKQDDADGTLEHQNAVTICLQQSTRTTRRRIHMVQYNIMSTNLIMLLHCVAQWTGNGGAPRRRGRSML